MPADALELIRRPGHELAAGLRSGEFSSVELIDAHLAAAERDNHGLHAWLTIESASARAEAAVADSRLANARREGAAGLTALPPLLGLPVALKDLVSVAGGQCTAGSRILAGYTAPYDAHITERLRATGAVILGKTNMDEFAMGSSPEHSAYGPTSNPWDLDRVPGGSSGGTAAAVAAFHAPFGIGTDTGGSIRQPAALCGIVGLKPTYGRVSRYGIVAFASSLDHIGPFARNVRDSATVLEVMAGRDPLDSTSAAAPVPNYAAHLDGNVRGMKLGVPVEYMKHATGETAILIDRAIGQLRGLGCDVREISLPATDYAIATYYIICTAEASSNLARFDGVRYGLRAGQSGTLSDMYRNTRGEGFGAEVKRRIMLGTYVLSHGYYDAYYRKAQQVRALITRDFTNAFQTVDAIVAPVSPFPAFRIGEKVDDPIEMYLSDIYTITGSLAGIPCMSVPCGTMRSPSACEAMFGAAIIILIAARRPSRCRPAGGRRCRSPAASGRRR